MIEILSNGALNLVEDVGRAEHLGKGVCTGGAMDASALRYANALLGNDENAAGIEVTIFPFRFKVQQNTWFACAGASTYVNLPTRRYPSWWAVCARAGDLVTIEPPQLGSRVVLAFQAGVCVDSVLGSRSTDLKSGFGGLEGRGLHKGDQLQLGTRDDGRTPRSVGIAPRSRVDFLHDLRRGVVDVHALIAAEFEYFSTEAQEAFSAAEYKLTPDCNRQGYRLEGPPLKLAAPLELLSHGIVPGTVQVPPAGQPIVQMAEANTIGGYPKIATVIEADLWRLAQLRPGQRVRFRLIDHAAALELTRSRQAEYKNLCQALTTAAPGTSR